MFGYNNSYGLSSGYLEDTVYIPADTYASTPLILYLVLGILAVALVGMSGILYNHDNYLDIISGFMGIFLSFTVSIMSINGTVYTSTSKLMSNGAFVTNYEIITSEMMHYLFLLIGMIAVLYVVILVYQVITESYKNILIRRYDL